MALSNISIKIRLINRFFFDKNYHKKFSRLKFEVLLRGYVIRAFISYSLVGVIYYLFIGTIRKSKVIKFKIIKFVTF